MDKPKTTAKDFFLWAGVVVSFYWSVIAYAFLVFDYINYTFPNALAYYPADPYQSGISYEMASIIVLFPIYLFLMWVIRKDYTLDPSRKEIWVRRWALILTLFIAGIAMAGDLITLLTRFLSGEELSTAFLLKVLIIFLIAAGVFMHFISDLRGYWDLFPKRQKAVRIGVGVLAIVTIISGFFIVGTPQEARRARFDAQKVSDLNDLQYRVTNYWQAKQKLPATIDDLSNSLNYGPMPTDPQTGAMYVYKATGALSFQLCAEFNTVSRNDGTVEMGGYFGRTAPSSKDTWWHATGTVCFDRTIDPSFYPPLTK